MAGQSFLTDQAAWTDQAAQRDDPCESCGYPHDAGDSVLVDAKGRVTCSAHCANWLTADDQKREMQRRRDWTAARNRAEARASSDSDLLATHQDHDGSAEGIRAGREIGKRIAEGNWSLGG